MKYAYMFLVMFICTVLHAQIEVPGISSGGDLTLRQILFNGDLSVSSLKCFTTETAFQWHDGKKVYKTVREVEYIFKETQKKITRKRNVIKVQTEQLCQDSKVVQIFPDMTSCLLSSVFSPNTIKKNEVGTSLPCNITRDLEKGITTVLIDKMALMEAHGMATTDKVMGTRLKYEIMAEKLHYATLADKLYLGMLGEVNTEVSLTSMDHADSIHRVEVKENIQINSFVKE